MKVTIEHDDDCPLGTNGLRAFDEAADALASTPPEARATRKDKFAIADAWSELQEKQFCTCGADALKAEQRQIEMRR